MEGYKGTKIVAITDRNGLPVAVYTYSASPYEVTLVEETLLSRFILNKPKIVTANKAYDSDKIDVIFKNKSIYLIASHKADRKRAKTQDESKLRRYGSTRIGNGIFFCSDAVYRSGQMSYDYYERNFLGFIQISDILKLLNNYFRDQFQKI